MTDPTPTVRRDDDASAYLIDLDGDVVGRAEFRARGPVLTFTHTKIDDDREGHHLGTTLIRAALDDVRARGEQIVPQCPFVAAFVDKHADYRDLLAATQA